jgi:Fe-S-cluster-containing dehydrogenase component
MIVIETERCDGCGVCVDACATGAIYLVGGKAVVDDELCSDFRDEMVTGTVACTAACPAKAIVLSECPRESRQDLNRLPAQRPEPEVMVVGAKPVPASLRATVLPIVGAALAWAGREIAPRLADHLLQSLDRRASNGRVAATWPANDPKSNRGQQGRRHRRRRRGS